MFISKRRYEAIVDSQEGLIHATGAINEALGAMLERVEALEAATPATDEKLAAFAEDIEGIKTDISELNDKLKPLEEEAETISANRKAERAILEGMSNILNYTGVKNGRGEQAQ